MLNPERFKDINPIFFNAARSLSVKFLPQPKSASRPVSRKPSYAKLKKFQGYREQLALICADLVQVSQAEGGYSVFPTNLEKEVQNLTQKVNSQTFRVAVVGEFSRGKSTFLNALLGEELQPVRAAPCSGTLTVLKHGAEKRAVCYYKDGTQAVIPFNQYRQKASIPKEAALGKQEELPESNITEIVLEHPGLELCRHRVEIVDSPGLNESSARTAVTEKLLENADAAIFLTKAGQLLSKNEQYLLRSLKHSLQEDSETPSDNLFLLVNFMDQLRSHEDKSDIIERAKNIVCDPEAPLLSSDNRIHFISAQSALDGILTQTTNEYSKPFAEFVGALETFLVEERGELTLRRRIADAQRLVSKMKANCKQASNLLEDNLIISKSSQQEILENIGEASGFNIKVSQLTEALLKEVLSDIDRSRAQWKSRLKMRLSQRSEHWITYEKSKSKIVKDYMEQCTKDFDEDIDKWLKENVVKSIVEPSLNRLTDEINEKVDVIKHDLQSIDDGTGASLCEQFELSNIDPAKPLVNWSFGSVGSTSFFTKIAAAISIITEAITNLFSGKDAEARKYELKQETLSRSVAQFLEVSDEILEKVSEDIAKAFNKKSEAFHKAASTSISLSCSLLELKENIMKGTLQQKEAGAAVIQKKDLQLHAIETALSDLTKTALS